MILNDRQRVELAIPARIMHGVVASGMEDPDDPEGKAILGLLNDACMAPIQGLHVKEQAKLARRIERTWKVCMTPYLADDQGKGGATAGKVGMICFYLMEALIEDGILILYEDTPMAQAIERFMPFIAEMFEIKAVDDSAKKQARHVLACLQREGYYRA